MYWTKVIIINCLIFFALIGIILISPPIIYDVYKFFKGSDIISLEDNRSKLSIYDNYSWAAQHFREVNQLNIKYYDYISWRRDDYSGETINIKNGLRQTSNVISENNSKTQFWFFGGSTIWGTGVSDDFTLPSLFAINSKNYTKNFGESGYIGRQSLAFLTNYIILNNYSDLNGVAVIFYDGVNDVAQRCRSEMSRIGTSQEEAIRKSVNSVGERRFSFEDVFRQPMDLLSVLIGRFNEVTKNEIYKDDWHVCDKNQSRALEVAETLVNTWHVASETVRNRGGQFWAILQPVSYFGKSEVSYLDLTSQRDEGLANQYNAVYPLIIELAAKRDINFLDFTTIYNNCSECYIDFNHVGPQGNNIAATKLNSELEKYYSTIIK